MSVTTLLVFAAVGILAIVAAAGKLPQRFPAVLAAYGLGLLIGFLGGVPAEDRELVHSVIEGCVAIAIPAMLLEASWTSLVQLGRQGAYAAISVYSGAFIAAASLQFVGQLPAVEVAMILAIFTGSLANLQVAGLALGVSEAELIAANLGDVVAGGLSFMLLSALGYRLATGLLTESRPLSALHLLAEAPPSLASDVTEAQVLPKGEPHLERLESSEEKISQQSAPIRTGLQRYAAALLLAGLALGLGVGLNALWRLSPKPDTLPPELVILGGATAVALTLGGMRWVKRCKLPAAGATVGEGLLLAFCVLVGTLADWSAVGWTALVWAAAMGIFIFIEVVVALVVARLLDVEAGTWLLALVGAVYSPAFVGPIAQAANRRDRVTIGVIVGLIGLALGTPLALLWVRWFA